MVSTIMLYAVVVWGTTLHLVSSVYKLTTSKRKHGEINYNLTQLFSGHGGYHHYRYRFEFDTPSHCPKSPGRPQPRVFQIPDKTRDSWKRRRDLERILGKVLLPENFVRRMLAEQEQWDAINSMITAMQRGLKKVEESRMARLPTPRTEERKPS